MPNPARGLLNRENRIRSSIQALASVRHIIACMIRMLFKETQNAPRPSEHPSVRGEKMSKRLGEIKGCKYKAPSWHLNWFPDGCCCCCFSYSAHWLPTRKRLLYTGANPARGLLNREKKRKNKQSGSAPPAPPPPPTLLVRRKKKNHATHPHV